MKKEYEDEENVRLLQGPNIRQQQKRYQKKQQSLRTNSQSSQNSSREIININEKPSSKSLENVKSFDIRDAKVSYAYIMGFTLIIGMSSMQMGLVMCSTGTVVSSLKYQLNWGEDPAKIDYYTTVLSSSNIVGIALGSIFGGDFIKYGRRPSIIAFNLLGLIGSAFSFLHSFYFLCFGRLLFGFSAGVIMCATPKMLDETIPAHLIEKGFGTSTNIIINLMVFLMLLMGMGIPESPAELMDSKYWMIIYGIQCPFQVLVIAFHVFVYTEDSIDFSIKQGHREEALRHIRKVYSPESPEVHTQIFQKKLNEQMAQTTNGHDSVWNALTHPDQRASSWMCVLVAFFNTVAGNGIVNIFSTLIFDGITRMGGVSVLTTKQENYLVGFSGLIGAILSFWSVTYFSRRTIFVGGHFIMGVLLFLVGYFIETRQQDLVILILCIFLTLYQATQGTAFWVYVSEICNSDAVMGICLFTLMFMLTVQAMTATCVMNTKIGIHGMFYVLAAINMCGFFLFGALMRETQGLTPQEKKELYRRQPSIKKQGDEVIQRSS